MANILIIGWIIFSIRINVNRPIKELGLRMSQIIQKKFDTNVVIKSRNEIGNLSRDISQFINFFRESMRQMIIINRTVIQMAEKIKISADRGVVESDTQVAKAESISTSAQEMSATIRSVAENATNVSQESETGT